MGRNPALGYGGVMGEAEQGLVEDAQRMGFWTRRDPLEPGFNSAYSAAGEAGSQVGKGSPATLSPGHPHSMGVAGGGGAALHTSQRTLCV